jgi:hypothetical protein
MVCSDENISLQYRGLYYKNFTTVIVAISQKARVFATSIHFLLSLVFVAKAKSLPLEWSPVRGSTLLGSSLLRKYHIRVEVNGSGKHSSLQRYSNNYDHKQLWYKGHIHNS